MSAGEDTGPFHVVIDVAYMAQEAWESFCYGDQCEAIKPLRDEVSTARMIGVEGLAPGADPARVGRPQAASG